MKVVRPEEHSAALSDWLATRRAAAVVSSVLIEIELPRATRRSAPGRLARVTAVLRGIGVLSLSPSIVARAAAYSESDLRSLDAIHLASAEQLRTATTEPLDGFVAYDQRLLAAARQIGLPAVAPGPA